MSIKEYLLNLKEKLGFFKKEEQKEEVSKNGYIIEELPRKGINSFLNWYAKHLPEWDENIKVEEEIKFMQNFIEKVAVWYELRYPDYAITGDKNNFMIDGISNYNMFEDNPYIKDLLGKDSVVNDLDWSEFYNTKSFINNLSAKEKEYFVRPSYEKYILINGYHLELNKNGKVISCPGLSRHYKLKSSMVIGKDIKEVVTLLKEKEIIPLAGSEIEKQIQIYEDKQIRKDNMLYATMCRIIERGATTSIGARRSLLFAREFKQITILPISFEIVLGYDPYIDVFLKEASKDEYLRENIKFLLSIFKPEYSKKDIDEMLKTKEEKEEEKQLHQRLVNVLANRVNEEEAKEGAKVLRIQRKLSKNRNAR